jgi:thioredoxin-related protein
MKMSRLVSLGMVSMLVCWGMFADNVRAEDGLWQTNFEKAKAQAKAEKKMILVDFTGSDWCGFCIKLHEEVFEKEPFKSEVSKQFVLVELDFPHEKKLPDDIKAQNEKLGKEYKVNGYPTVCLMDADGQVIGKFVGYGPGTAAKFLERLADLPKIWESVLKMKAELANVQGIERAKLLDQLVEAYENKLSNPIDELDAWGEDIIKLDADNKAGLKNKYVCREILADAEKLGATQKFAEAVATLDKALALEGLPSELKKDVFFKQSMFQFNLKEFAAALKNMKKALEAAPESDQAAELKGRIDTLTTIVEDQTKMVKDLEGLEKSAGIERAKILDTLIEDHKKLLMYGASKATPPEINKWTAEIIELDADNAAGLKLKYEFTTLINEASVLAREKKFEEGLAAIDKALALTGITPEQKQDGLIAKGLNYLNQKNFEKSVDAFKQAEEAAPQGPSVGNAKAYRAVAEQQQKKKAAEQAKKDEPKPEEKS